MTKTFSLRTSFFNNYCAEDTVTCCYIEHIRAVKDIGHNTLRMLSCLKFSEVLSVSQLAIYIVQF